MGQREVLSSSWACTRYRILMYRPLPWNSSVKCSSYLQHYESSSCLFRDCNARIFCYSANGLRDIYLSWQLVISIRACTKVCCKNLLQDLIWMSINHYIFSDIWWKMLQIVLCTSTSQYSQREPLPPCFFFNICLGWHAFKTHTISFCVRQCMTNNTYYMKSYRHVNSHMTNAYMKIGLLIDQSFSYGKCAQRCWLLNMAKGCGTLGHS